MKVMVEAEVDLEDVPASILRRELDGRKRAINDRDRDNVRLASDLRTAFYARNASRFEALLIALDPQDEPTVGLYGSNRSKELSP